MKVIVDLNILLDVLLKREPFYTASAAIVELITRGVLQAALPAHGLTTLYYLIRKAVGKTRANAALSSIFEHFTIVHLERADWNEALVHSIDDFEDAVVAVTARVFGSEYIITRDEDDFVGSAVMTVSPSKFMERHGILQS